MKFLRECGLLVVIAMPPALLSGWLHPKRPEWTKTEPSASGVAVEDVAHWTSPLLWIDAREANAYSLGHIPGALSLNEGHWERSLPKVLEAWQPDMKVVVYCDSLTCDASQAVALRLKRELNLSDVFVLRGGFASWENRHR